MDVITGAVTSAVNFLILGVGNLLSYVFYMLPPSPFKFLSGLLFNTEFAKNLGWILPIRECLATIELWLSAVLVYYAYSLILRWIKAIE